ERKAARVGTNDFERRPAPKCLLDHVGRDVAEDDVVVLGQGPCEAAVTSADVEDPEARGVRDRIQNRPALLLIQLVEGVARIVGAEAAPVASLVDALVEAVTPR